jgi:hypothetical protein
MENPTDPGKHTFMGLVLPLFFFFLIIVLSFDIEEKPAVIGSDAQAPSQ